MKMVSLLLALLGFSLLPVVPNQLEAATIIKFKEGGNLQALQAKTKGVRYLPSLGLAIVKSSLPPSSPDVDFQEDDQPIEMAALPNDTYLGESFHLGWADELLNYSSAWGKTTGASDLVVAILDTGIDLYHKDLQGNIWVNSGEIPSNGSDDDHNGYTDDVTGYDFINDDIDPSDDSGHGTHVAGIIGAVGDNEFGIAGMNWRVSLLPLKIADAEGNGRTSAVLEAIDYAIRSGARIINASWVVRPKKDGMVSLEAMQHAFEKLEEKGILVVAAAGNGRDGEGGKNLSEEPFYPASLHLGNFLVAAAVNSEGKLTPVSNYGSESVDLGAPGHSVLSTYPGDRFQRSSGTSVSAAFITGAAGLVLALHPEWKAEQLVQALKSTARPVDDLQGRVGTGGVLDVGKAVEWQPVQVTTASGSTSSQAKDIPVEKNKEGAPPPPSRGSGGGCSRVGY